MICAKCSCDIFIQDGNIFHNINQQLKDAESIWICGDCFQTDKFAGRGMDREEYNAMQELLKMSKEELDNVEYKLMKWRCQGKDCQNGTKVRDYGISPYFYLERKNEGWRNLNIYWWNCGKHNKMWKELIKSYPQKDVFDRLMDIQSPKERLISIEFTKSDKINA